MHIMIGDNGNNKFDYLFRRLWNLSIETRFMIMSVRFPVYLKPVAYLKEFLGEWCNHNQII